MADSGYALSISIPARKQWFQLVLFPLWLTGWTFGGIAAITAIVKSFELFLLVWLAFWLVGEIMVSYSLLRMLTGREIIEVSASSIALRNDVLGLSFPKVYLAEYIHDLRVCPTPAAPAWGWNSRNAKWWSASEGVLAFDYGAKTIRLAGDIDEAEGKQILATILQKYPQYKSD